MTTQPARIATRLPRLIAGALLLLAVFAPRYWAPGRPLANAALAAADPAVANLLKDDLTDPAGRPATLATFQGQTLVVNFWASWCGPCVREMPMLDKLARQYAKKGVRFIGVGVDSQENVQNFLAKVQVGYPVFVSGYGGADLARRLGDAMGGLPFTVVIDKNGQIVSTQVGAVRVDALEHALAAH